MKKTMFLLAILLIFSMFAFASCEWLPWGDNEDPCTEHVDANADGKCDNCGADVEVQQPGDSDGEKPDDSEKLTFVQKVARFFRRIVDAIKNFFIGLIGKITGK